MSVLFVFPKDALKYVRHCPFPEVQLTLKIGYNRCPRD